MQTKVMVATSNPHKVEEMSYYLQGLGLTLVTPKEAKITQVPAEEGNTFEQNAISKALFYSKVSGVAAIADDSGLCVDSIGQEPGIHSARWAQEYGGYAGAIDRIKEKASVYKEENPRAKFVCSLAIGFNDGTYFSCQGQVFGNLNFEKYTPGGFGYDSIFIPDGYQKTFYEMSKEEKYKCSHRFNAFKELLSNWQKVQIKLRGRKE